MEHTKDNYTVSGSENLQIMTQQHEREQQKEDHNFQLQMQKQQHDHENGLKEKDLGWLGKIFGDEKISSKNITAFFCGILLIGVIVFSLVIYSKDSSDKNFISQLWDYVLPIITLSLGYLFGKN